MGLNSVKITIMSGAEDGKVFGLEKNPFILGRHPDDDVCLPYDTRVSRHHARITRDGEVYSIEDKGPEGKGSTNGTYVGNKKIAAKTTISSGEMILLGGVLVKFEFGTTRISK
jgi:pSer/pThr/pTyr-binding forkhead associated (FHA) protein